MRVQVSEPTSPIGNHRRSFEWYHNWPSTASHFSKMRVLMQTGDLAFSPNYFGPCLSTGMVCVQLWARVQWAYRCVRLRWTVTAVVNGRVTFRSCTVHQLITLTTITSTSWYTQSPATQPTAPSTALTSSRANAYSQQVLFLYDLHLFYIYFKHSVCGILIKLAVIVSSCAR